jgi:restriction system protein
VLEVSDLGGSTGETGMARRRQGGFELIASTLWPVGIVLGIVTCVGVRYGISEHVSSSSNAFLAPIAKAANGGATSILAWTLLGICWAAAFASFIGRRQRDRLLETQTGLDSLRAMNWKQFELLRRLTPWQSRKGHADSMQAMASQRVDVKVAGEMYGPPAHHGADAVKIVAVGDFTSDAHRSARGKPLQRVRDEAPLALIQGVQSVQNTASASTAVPTKPKLNLAGATTPDCPSCGASMVKRTNRHSRYAFWGCTKYPSCRGTRPA